jgi:two-component system cell cycle sensor histidine kinase/response regulator CckA
VGESTFGAGEVAAVPEPLRVLIVEDRRADAELMVLHLEGEGFDAVWARVETEADYLAELEAAPDLILADWSLPTFSGLRALRAVRGRGLDIPFIIVSGSVGEEAAIDALHGGADDYVLKDRLARLGPAVRRALESRREHDEQQRLREQLAQAEKLESVGRLAGGIAHDFNNMLTVILGYVEMALGRVDPADPLHDDLETVLDAARRSAELTAQLLAFARKQVVRPRVMELNEVVTITLRMLERLLGEQIEVVWRPAAGLWATVVDPTQVDRVLANLCINARDAIAGSGRIEITTANVAFGEDEHAAPAGHMRGEWVRLSVHDTGRGMSAEVMKHIFEPFFTTKDAAGGSGLGLATVEGLAAQTGGFVDVESRPGEGSTFSVYLPRSRRPSDPDDRRSPDRRAPGELRLGAGETVLLVEDEVAVLRLVGEQLRQLGYAVLPAGIPEEAVRIAETHAGSIDLILSDVVLPGSSGPTLVEQIGRLRPHAGRLLMSGYPSLVSSQDAAPGGRVSLLSKPFTVERLAAAVGAALDARPPADPPSTHR